MWKSCCDQSPLCLWWVGQKQQVGMGRESPQVEDQTCRLSTMSCVFITQGGPEQGPAGRARRPAGDVAAWISILPHPAQHSWENRRPPHQPLCPLGQVGLITQPQAHAGWSSRITVTGSGMAAHQLIKGNPGGSESTLLSHLESPPENRAKVMETGASSERHLSTWTQFVVVDWIFQSHQSPSPSVFMPCDLPILHQDLGQFLHLPSGWSDQEETTEVGLARFRDSH